MQPQALNEAREWLDRAGPGGRDRRHRHSAGAGSTLSERSMMYERHSCCPFGVSDSSSDWNTNVPWPVPAFSHVVTCGVTSQAPLSPVVAPLTPAVSAGEVGMILSRPP